MSDIATVRIDPKAIPAHVMTMLARGALQGIRKSLEDPEYRARLEERLAQREAAGREHSPVSPTSTHRPMLTEQL